MYICIVYMYTMYICNICIYKYMYMYYYVYMYTMYSVVYYT